MRLLITAGPTREHLDPVRFLSNGSSGRMGFALAEAAVARGYEVDLVSGPVSLADPRGVRTHRVVSAAEMFAACEPLFAVADAFIAVAAVADYRPAERSDQKSKKADGPFDLRLVPNIDILATLSARRRPGQIIVGFAAETTDVEASARRKLAAKNLDWIVANDVGQPGIGMDAPDNAVLVLSRSGERIALGPAPKVALAASILDRLFGERPV